MFARAFILLTIAACRTSSPAPRGSAIPHEVVVAQPTYPVRYPAFTEPDRLARVHEIEARNPGWEIAIDEYGFLISARSSTSYGDDSVAASDLPVYQEFLDRNRDVLGLEAPIDLAHLPAKNKNPASNRYSLLYKQPITESWYGTITMRKLCPKASPRAGCAFPSVEGHAWPGWHGLPPSMTHDELIKPHLGKPIAYTEVRCRDFGTCSGRDSCTETVRTGTVPLRRDDVLIHRSVQPYTDPTTHALELRLHAIITIRSGGCTQSDHDEWRVVQERSLWIPWVDGVTGMPLSQ
jgi:hypothetical protein